MIKQLALLIIVTTASAGKLHASNGSLVGKWKLNPAKSTAHDQMNVTSLGGNRYAFNFGSGPEMIAVDGTDQTGLQGTSLAVHAKSSHSWNVVRRKDGRMLLSAIWTLAQDGKSLRDDFTGYRPDGSSYTIHYTYTPIGSASGFSAIWDSITEKPSQFSIEIAICGNRGLSVTNLGDHSTKCLRLDDNDYPVEGQGGAVGSVLSSRRIGSNTVESTEKHGGRVSETQRLQLSEDGSVLVMTIQPVSRRRPDVLVFERE